MGDKGHKKADRMHEAVQVQEVHLHWRSTDDQFPVRTLLSLPVGCLKRHMGGN